MVPLVVKCLDKKYELVDVVGERDYYGLEGFRQVYYRHEKEHCFVDSLSMVDTICDAIPI